MKEVSAWEARSGMLRPNFASTSSNARSRPASATCVTPHHCFGAWSAPSRAVRDAPMATAGAAPGGRFTTWTCSTRSSWDLYARVDDHRIVGTFARFSTAQQRILRSPAGVRLNDGQSGAAAGRELKHKRTSPSDRSGNARPRSDHLQLAARDHTPMRTAYRRRLFPAGHVVRS